MNVTQSIQKWGNGTGVRLPKKVLVAAHLKVNQPLAISLKGSSIILTPLDEVGEITLSGLLKGVTPSLIGGEVDWGKDIGAERYE